MGDYAKGSSAAILVLRSDGGPSLDHNNKPAISASKLEIFAAGGKRY